jgi:hypothetical protein
VQTYISVPGLKETLLYWDHQRQHHSADSVSGQVQEARWVVDLFVWGAVKTARKNIPLERFASRCLWDRNPLDLHLVVVVVVEMIFEFEMIAVAVSELVRSAEGQSAKH